MVRRKQPSSRSNAATPAAVVEQPQDASIWRDVHSRLEALGAVRKRLHPALEAASSAFSRIPEIEDPEDAIKLQLKLDKALEAANRETDAEEAEINACLEKLAILLALREAPPDPPSGCGRHKKRRIEGSPAPSLPGDASSRRSSPLSVSTASSNLNAVTAAPSPIPVPGTPREPLSIMLSLSKNSSSRAGSRSATPAPPGSAKGRPGAGGSASCLGASGNSTGSLTGAMGGLGLELRAHISRQLPLKPDRLVAFRRPRKGEDGNDEWIMARVVRCLGGDKKRYEVQDIDSPEDGAQPPKFSTTVKSLIPLPIKDAPETYATLGFPAGTRVLALYPETTSFYKGKIKSGPSEKGRKYKVMFEDDEENGALSIVMEHVVPLPER